jgi:hypothetical protein
VTLGEIMFAINENNCTTIKDIQDTTDAGSACKCCISKDDDFGEPKIVLYIQDILNKVIKDDRYGK